MHRGAIDQIITTAVFLHRTNSDRECQGWVVWEEEGRYPDVIVQLMFPSTARVDMGVKEDLYDRTFCTADYFVYDPFGSASLQVWHLDVAQRYQPLEPRDRGCLWCETLQLWLGTWEGSVRREPPTGTCHWLRFYDRDGNLVPCLKKRRNKKWNRNSNGLNGWLIGCGNWVKIQRRSSDRSSPLSVG